MSFTPKRQNQCSGLQYTYTLDKRHGRILLTTNTEGNEYKGTLGPFPIAIKEIQANGAIASMYGNTLTSCLEDMRFVNRHPSIVPILLWDLTITYNSKMVMLTVITPIYQTVKMTSVTFKDVIDMADAINYLHSFHVCHGRISPNYLRRNPESGRIMITGFMESNIYHYLHMEVRYENLVRDGKGYWAPEIFSEENEDETDEDGNPSGLFTGAADIYSLCVIWVEVMTGKPAVTTENLRKSVKSILNGNRPESKFVQTLDPDTSSFIEKCWNMDASSRPPIKEVLSFLYDIHRKDLAIVKIQNWWKKKIFHNPHHPVGYAVATRGYEAACSGKLC